MSIKRIKELAGLKEAELPDDSLHGDIDDEIADREDNERYDREQKVRTIIKAAFKRVGIQIETDANLSEGVFYDEQENREAIVSLYKNEISASSLAKLMQSGLAHDFIVESGNHELTLKFNVVPEIDHVIMKKGM